MRLAVSVITYFCLSPLIAEFQAEPGEALSLHLNFSEGLKSQVGPAARNTPPATFKVGKTDDRVSATARDDAESLVVADWPALKLFSNAQGAISFWAKTTLKQPEEKPSFIPVARLSDTAGGSFLISFHEGMPSPKMNANVAGDDELPELGQQALSLKEETTKPDKEDLVDELENAKKPIGSFQCRMESELFSFGMPGPGLGSIPVFETSKEQWHHVVVSWRSVHCEIYIDGKKRGGDKWLSRMQPFTSKEARLELYVSPNSQIADLRVYKRAFGAELAAALAKANTEEYLPPLPQARVWVDWGRLTGRAVVFVDAGSLPATSAELKCMEAKTGRVMGKHTLEGIPNGLGEAALAVMDRQHFPDGEYRFEATLLDKAGNEIIQATSESWRADPLDDNYKKFIGSRAGLDKKVEIIPPFTAIEIEGDVVKTVLRDHTLHPTGFFKSILAHNSAEPDGASEELLDGPVRLYIHSDGEPISFEAGERSLKTTNRQTEADWTATTTNPQGHTLQVHGHVEYDGVTRFEVTFSPSQVLEIDSVELRIPIRHEVLKLMHSVGSGFIHRFLKVWDDGQGKYLSSQLSWSHGGASKPHRSDGVIFDAYFNHNLDDNPWKFASFLHVGNYYRGLSWFADNDQGWVHDRENVPNMEVVARGNERYIRLNIVAKKTQLSAPLKFRFYLLANPFKPMPKDWRSWMIGDYKGPLSKSKHRFWWHWGEYASGFRPYPGGELAGKYEDWLGRFKNDETVHAPFINFGTPGGSGMFIEEGKVLPYSWKTHNNRPVNDYIAYWMDRCVREIGIKGVYVDEPYSEPNSWNVLAGDAPYIAPDGTRRPGTRWMEGRQYFRRLKQVFADHHIPQSVWVHTSHWKGMPYFTFIDISMDGEFPSIWVKSFDDYHIFYPHPEFQRGYESGIPYGFVGSQMLNANFNPRTFPQNWKSSRTYLAITLPFSVVAQNTNIPDELYRIHEIYNAFDIYDEDLGELPYFDRGSWLPETTINSDLHLGGTINRKRHEALLFAMSKGDELHHAIGGGFKTLLLGKTHNHAWNAETGVSLSVDNETYIEQQFISDVTSVLVRGADTPQKSRPKGVLMGVSFDAGFEPDFGAGIVPPTIRRAAESPANSSSKGTEVLAINAGSSAAGYPVVPSWVEGSVEFDLKIERVEAKPIRLISLKHHLDTELSAVSTREGHGLRLVTRELPPATDTNYASGKLDPLETTLNVNFPVSNSWTRIAMTWRAGQYKLYINGKLAGQLSAPAAPRLRSAKAMVPGIWVGDTNATGRASATLDSLLVYEWALDKESVAAYKSRAALQPAPIPESSTSFPVWLWGKEGQSPTEFSYAVHFHRLPDWQQVHTVSFQLFKKTDMKNPIAKERASPWLGTALTHLTPTQAAMDLTKAGNLSLLGEEDEDPAGVDAEDGGYFLQIDLLQRDGKTEKALVSRRISFEAGLENPSGEY